MVKKEVPTTDADNFKMEQPEQRGQISKPTPSSKRSKREALRQKMTLTLEAEKQQHSTLSKEVAQLQLKHIIMASDLRNSEQLTLEIEVMIAGLLNYLHRATRLLNLAQLESKGAVSAMGRRMNRMQRTSSFPPASFWTPIGGLDAPNPLRAPLTPTSPSAMSRAMSAPTLCPNRANNAAPDIDDFLAILSSGQDFQCASPALEEDLGLPSSLSLDDSPFLATSDDELSLPVDEFEFAEETAEASVGCNTQALGEGKDTFSELVDFYLTAA